MKIRNFFLLLLSVMLVSFSYKSLKKMADVGQYNEIYRLLHTDSGVEKDVRLSRIYFQTLLKTKRYSEALNFNELRLKLYPQNVKLLANALFLSVKLRDVSRISKYSEIILRLKPFDTQALLNKIRISLNADKLYNALSLFTRVKDGTRKKQSLYGIYLYKTGHYVQSRLELLKALNNDYNDSSAHLYLGYIGLRAHDYQGALSDFKLAANSFFASDSSIKRLIAYCYYKSGAPAEANKYLPNGDIWNRSILLGQPADALFKTENSFVSLYFTMKEIPQIIDKPDSYMKVMLDNYRSKGDKNYDYGLYERALFFYYTSFKLYGRDTGVIARIIKTYNKLGLLRTARDFFPIIKGLDYDTLSVQPVMGLIDYEQGKKISAGLMESREEFGQYMPPQHPIYLHITNDIEHFIYWNKSSILKYFLNLYSDALDMRYHFYLKHGKNSDEINVSFIDITDDKVVMKINYAKNNETKQYSYTGKDIFYNVIFDIMQFVRNNMSVPAHLIVYDEMLGGFTGLIDQGIAQGLRRGDTLTNSNAAAPVKIKEAYDTFSLIRNIGKYGDMSRGMSFKRSN